MRRHLKLLLVLFGVFIFPSSLAFAGNIQYTYDNLNRLIKVDYGNGKIIQYAYDQDGNRTEKNVTVPVPAPADVTSQITVNRSGFRYNRVTHQFIQQVTLKNSSENSIDSPIYLELDSLSSNATLVNETGTTKNITPTGSPYIEFMETGSLDPGSSTSVMLNFADPTRAGITFTTSVLAGLGNP